jgi:hypothetical protein
MSDTDSISRYSESLACAVPTSANDVIKSDLETGLARIIHTAILASESFFGEILGPHSLYCFGMQCSQLRNMTWPSSKLMLPVPDKLISHTAVTPLCNINLPVTWQGA